MPSENPKTIRWMQWYNGLTPEQKKDYNRSRYLKRLSREGKEMSDSSKTREAISTAIQYAEEKNIS